MGPSFHVGAPSRDTIPGVCGGVLALRVVQGGVRRDGGLVVARGGRVCRGGCASLSHWACHAWKYESQWCERTTGPFSWYNVVLQKASLGRSIDLTGSLPPNYLSAGLVAVAFIEASDPC
jgi:hypothetical protein